VLETCDDTLLTRLCCGWLLWQIKQVLQRSSGHGQPAQVGKAKLLYGTWVQEQMLWPPEKLVRANAAYSCECERALEKRSLLQRQFFKELIAESPQSEKCNFAMALFADTLLSASVAKHSKVLKGVAEAHADRSISHACGRRSRACARCSAPTDAHRFGRCTRLHLLYCSTRRLPVRPKHIDLIGRRARRRPVHRSTRPTARTSCCPTYVPPA
jgi:hypothetical protein